MARVGEISGTIDKALELFGTPIYAYHEIVHNRPVVERFRDKGVVFVESMEANPEGATVLYSAHGVSPVIREASARRRLRAIDATCPLVTKVHREAEIHHRRGRHIVLVGHRGHPEVIGTMGQLPAGAVRLIETAADARAFTPADPAKLGERRRERSVPSASSVTGRRATTDATG